MDILELVQALNEADIKTLSVLTFWYGMYLYGGG